MTEIHFELARTSKNRSLNIRNFTVNTWSIVNGQCIFLFRIRKANAAVKIEIDKLTEEIHM